jgi:hypothetical protein
MLLLVTWFMTITNGIVTMTARNVFWKVVDDLFCREGNRRVAAVCSSALS